MFQFASLRATGPRPLAVLVDARKPTLKALNHAEAIWGDDARVRSVEWQEVTFAEYGNTAGTPVVFFQGTPSTRLMHPPEAVTEELGVRLLAVDRPGFGGSEPAPGRTLVEWAENIVELLDHLAVDTFRIVGVSGGGPYVLATAWRWPARVLSASVCGGSGPLELRHALKGAAPVRKAAYWLARYVPRLFRILVRLHADPRNDTEKFIRHYTAHNPAADQLIIADPDFRAQYATNFQEAYRQGPEAFADEVILGSRYWGFDLSEIRVPIQFWHGALDTSTPLGMSKGMAEQVAQGQLTILPDQGHLFVYGPLWREILSQLLRQRTAPPQPVGI